jgi:uncharacterized OsmC-like protein
MIRRRQLEKTIMEMQITPISQKNDEPVRLNGLDTVALQAAVAALTENPALAPVAFRASTTWQGAIASRTQVTGYDMAGATFPRSHTILSDEPKELLGGDSAPNPQELLLAALNACMTVGFVAAATARGVRLTSLRIDSSLGFDLRGAFGIDKQIRPGADAIQYRVEISGDATREQFEEIHREVMATSPNRWHVSQPIRLDSELVVR